MQQCPSSRNERCLRDLRCDVAGDESPNELGNVVSKTNLCMSACARACARIRVRALHLASCAVVRPCILRSMGADHPVAIANVKAISKLIIQQQQ